ncbi:MAG: hypothetical protein ABI267_04905 [Ginsengibacter sp.]
MTSKDFSPTTKIYKGNLLSTFRVLLSIGFLIFLAYWKLDNPKVILKSPDALVVISFVGIFIIAMTVFQLYYFVIDGDQFVVKNQILIWTKTTFEFRNILEIEFVDKLTAGSSSAFSLRVVNKNAKSKVYRAASLDKKTWRVLLDDLKKQKIIVNDSGTQFDNYGDSPSPDAGPSDEG